MTHPLATPTLPLKIGAPVWACGEWSGQVYPPRTPRDQWLQWYSRTFNVVEGNSTFYALPPEQTFAKWAEQSVPGFQFSFKFPRLISHDWQLQKCDEATGDFLKRLKILADADRLGPTFLQLGPSFGPDRFDDLKRYLKSLPSEYPWAVELRHFDWFDDAIANSPGHERRVDDLLNDLGVDKVLFDSRPLYQSEPDDPVEAISQTRKPKTPIRKTVTGLRPMLRMVGRNRVELADVYFQEWASTVATWIHDGLEPVVFTHAPDDRFAPELARRFLSFLQPELPEYDLSLPLPEMPDQQLSLFGDDL